MTLVYALETLAIACTLAAAFLGACGVLVRFRRVTPPVRR